MSELDNALRDFELYAEQPIVTAKVANTLLDKVIELATPLLSPEQSATISRSMETAIPKYLSNDLSATVSSFVGLGRLLNRGLMATPATVAYVNKLDNEVQRQAHDLFSDESGDGSWVNIGIGTRKTILYWLNTALAQDMTAYSTILKMREHNHIGSPDAAELIPVLMLVESLLGNDRSKKEGKLSFPTILEAAIKNQVGTTEGLENTLGYFNSNIEAIHQQISELQTVQRMAGYMSGYTHAAGESTAPAAIHSKAPQTPTIPEKGWVEKLRAYLGMDSPTS